MEIEIGSDIIEVARIAASIERHQSRFLDRHFTQAEQEYCNRYKESARNYAGRFAAKEAIVKAFGTGFRDGITFLDMEILNNENGKPEVQLSGEMKDRWSEGSIKLSISHCREFAVATAIVIL